ncbi:heavy metal-responsive transcriptional regulator [Pseudonocardia nigra]|uniref:heavy metal-responsive transcriptional regulator n=1 Tax=Pseudonocardia nigra TaxID=1921578 RepID=UPI001C60476B|nr:heavy metal-responsive transcriptional regulator [Pseudonocardia nigra]
MRIGELAERVGVNTKTIRYYESINLLPQAARTAAGYRIYGPDDEARLAFIKTAQQLGLTLDEVRDVLALRDAGTTPCEHVRAVLRTRVREISRRITELRRKQKQLRALETRIDDIPEDGATICRIIEHAAGHRPCSRPSRRTRP